jgi:transcriptional regulator with XRE-family HTH domain
MNKQEQLIKIRKRKLGILMMDARTAARRSSAECAQVMAVSEEQYLAYESGADSPSLPLLETLALFLDTPIEHFWTSSSLVEKPNPLTEENMDRLRKLRDRLIGASLRQNRDKSNLSLAQLAEATSLPEAQLKRYELGQDAIPVPELELITQAVGIRVDDLFDQHGPVGAWRLQYQATKDYSELPQHLRQFVSKPVNRPYLELAIRLSDLSVEKLRAVAEGLLEITY